NTVPDATSYRLDVSTTPFENFNIVGWTFPTAAVTNDIGSTNNNINSRALSSNSSITVSGGQASRKGWNLATNTDYWQIAVNTIGHSNIGVKAVQTGDNPNSPRDFQVQWSLTGNPNNSNEWSNVGQPIVMSTVNTPAITDLTLPEACNNQPIV